MAHTYLCIEQSTPLHGSASISGAKNSVLAIMASLILTKGVSILHNVPQSSDVDQMILLLKNLGAQVKYVAEMKTLTVDTSHLQKWDVSHDIMKKMRASILVMGPLLARFGRADIALPGGCVIGARPVDYHLINFKKMGVEIAESGHMLCAHTDALQATKIILEYPSVGATENILMAATQTKGVTTIVNAALEPEVLDLIAVLRKMGADITILPPASIEVKGVDELLPIEHTVLNDRLEAGALLLAAAITGGSITLPDAPAFALELFLDKLQQMGHAVIIGDNGVGIALTATKEPRAVSFKTGPYPSFPTDLQAPMMALQCVAEGVSVVEETVFENRFLHIKELQKMGAEIQVEHNKAIVTGVEQLYGAQVIATDIRASTALVLAGLVAQGTTLMSGVHHWLRGYDALEAKLKKLGAPIKMIDAPHQLFMHEHTQLTEREC